MFVDIDVTEVVASGYGEVGVEIKDVIGNEKFADVLGAL